MKFTKYPNTGTHSRLNVIHVPHISTCMCFLQGDRLIIVSPCRQPIQEEGK